MKMDAVEWLLVWLSGFIVVAVFLLIGGLFIAADADPPRDVCEWRIWGHCAARHHEAAP